MNNFENTMLDDYGDYCAEVRILPFCENQAHYVGIKGYQKEIEHRKYMNSKQQPQDTKWDLPAWESLKLYFKNGEYYE